MSLGDDLSITYDLSAYSHIDSWVDHPEQYLTRYFSQHLYANPIALCVVGVARQHPLLDLDRRDLVGNIVRVEFAPSVRGSIIKGKGKKQSLRVLPDTKICTIHTDSGKEYAVRAAIKGHLMEWNAGLEDDPQLVTRCPEKAFVAIIKPSTDDKAKILSECVSSPI
ncbi:hypothetical protein H4R26_001139 [Coemansia thaxteri]|uniref:Protein Abitram n=1 Tax=Coemansia thaxteri TaxID=2663907 RepID=A0A9W8BH42_9FUNG|nr:hypothetical protein H4R26_001139 [Coemansia thaxteri]